MKVVSNRSFADWSNFVENHPDGNIFQTPDMQEFIKRVKTQDTIFLAAVDTDDKIIGVLLSIIQREGRGLKGWFSGRSIIWGGPLVECCSNEEEIVDMLLAEYNEIAKRKALYTQIRNMWNTEKYREVFEKNGYDYEEHLNIIVDISKNEDELWGNLSQGKRRGIRKARKSGVEISEIHTVDEIENLYEVLKEVYQNAQLPLANLDYFLEAFNTLHEKNLVKFFIAVFEGNCIGGIMCLIYHGRIYELYVGGSRHYSKQFPSEMVTWHPIEWGSQNGYSIFDFGGAGKPNEDYGVRDFKKGFGGEIVNFGRYTKVYFPKVYRFSMWSFNMYKKIKARLDGKRNPPK